MHLASAKHERIYLRYNTLRVKQIKLLLVLFVVISCNNDDTMNTETELPFLFENGFEISGNDIDDLILPDASSWTNIQLQDPNNGTNTISISTDKFNEGEKSLKIVALPSDEILSKADIEKFGFNAPIGSSIKIEADFYINTSEDLTDLFLLDLECCSCWDPNVPDNQCPGVRLKIGGDNEYLSIERGKIINSTIGQSEISFPKFEWVNVVWEMELSQENTGRNKLSINGIEVISSEGINMPNAELFKQEFASAGLDFKLPEDVFYERVQIGATANPTPNSIEMYIDNFKLTIE